MSDRTCSVEGCAGPVAARGWCNTHRLRVAKYGTTDLPKRLTSEEKFWQRVDQSGDCWLWTGAIDGRERLFFWGDNGRSVDAVRFSYELSRGRKLSRSERARRICADKLCVRPEHLVVTPSERFWSKVEKTDTCWSWVGNRNIGGYGVFTIGGKEKVTVAAHRWSYAQTHGDIPEGMMIDHECRNRSCVNPSHLRIATGKQNSEHQQTTNRKSASGIRGVFPKDGQWRAGARHNGKMIYAGYFRDINDAAEAARQLRIKLYTHNNEDREDAA